MSFKTCKWIQNIQGTCKVRNEFEKKRNWTKQNETNWNETENGKETKLKLEINYDYIKIKIHLL